LTLLLDSLPDSIKTRREALSGRFVLAGTLDDFERAYDAAKYGELPATPILEGVIPTLLDPALALPGKHLVSVNIRTLPYILNAGDWASRRDGLAAQALERLDSAFPGLRQRVEGHHLLTPEDYAETYALPDGDIHNGQMALDQMFVMRPIPAAARYQTPLEGLYLCGAGSHPGAGVTGFPGLLAARQILDGLAR
jgi:phytoene dehydrogenase-like protein